MSPPDPPSRVYLRAWMKTWRERLRCVYREHAWQDSLKGVCGVHYVERFCPRCGKEKTATDVRDLIGGKGC